MFTWVNNLALDLLDTGLTNGGPLVAEDGWLDTSCININVLKKGIQLCTVLKEHPYNIQDRVNSPPI